MKEYKIAFIGKTGVGKSSLINALFGTRFETAEIESCTSWINSATIINKKISKKEFSVITVIDTPGFGETQECDRIYQWYYEKVVSEADCIILVVTLERTDAIEQRLLEKLQRFVKMHCKFIICINHIDSEGQSKAGNSVWNDIEKVPTELRLKDIEERVQEIIRKYEGRFLPFKVVSTSAQYAYGIINLEKAIFN